MQTAKHERFKSPWFAETGADGNLIRCSAPLSAAAWEKSVRPHLSKAGKHLQVLVQDDEGGLWAQCVTWIPGQDPDHDWWLMEPPPDEAIRHHVQRSQMQCDVDRLKIDNQKMQNQILMLSEGLSSGAALEREKLLGVPIREELAKFFDIKSRADRVRGPLQWQTNTSARLSSNSTIFLEFLSLAYQYLTDAEGTDVEGALHIQDEEWNEAAGLRIQMSWESSDRGDDALMAELSRTSLWLKIQEMGGKAYCENMESSSREFSFFWPRHPPHVYPPIHIHAPMDPAAGMSAIFLQTVSCRLFDVHTQWHRFATAVARDAARGGWGILASPRVVVQQMGTLCEFQKMEPHPHFAVICPWGWIPPEGTPTIPMIREQGVHRTIRNMQDRILENPKGDDGVR